MAFYKNFENGDVVFDNATITSGLFQDGGSSIDAFHSSSTQHTNTGDYNIDVYRNKFYNLKTQDELRFEFLKELDRVGYYGLI